MSYDEGMKINTKYTGIEPTTAIEVYIEKRLKSLEKLIKSVDPYEEGELFLDVGRTTKHHNKGEVYKAVIELDVPGKDFRVSEQGEDLRASLDAAKNKLKILVEKFKERTIADKKK
jgi:ribosomal subunit interface protein